MAFAPVDTFPDLTFFSTCKVYNVSWTCHSPRQTDYDRLVTQIDLACRDILPEDLGSVTKRGFVFVERRVSIGAG
jgi:hypothetical protein